MLSTALHRWLLLSAAALLLRAELTTSASFHLIASSLPGATFDGTPYSAVYDVTLIGTETPTGSGEYTITGASGTRTFNSGAPVRVNSINTLRHGRNGSPTNNQLYATPSSQSLNLDGNAYLDYAGIGLVLSEPTEIFPGFATNYTFLYFDGGGADYAEGAQQGQNFASVAKYAIIIDKINTGAGGDPVFTGFHAQRFSVKGEVDRVYNILSLPSLQLNTRFVAVQHAMNATQQLSVRQRAGRLISALRGAEAATGPSLSLPLTTAWSHAGLYMGEAGIQVSGQRLLVQAGAYEQGFGVVQLDGVAVPVSAAAVELLDGSSIRRPTSSVLEVQTAEVRFQLRNSDHFLNMHSAELSTAVLEQLGHIDGLLGQTADAQWKADSKSAIFVQHVEHDFELPAGEGELWSTAFAHTRYEV